MSSKTTNYNLHKIDLNDSPPDITVLNDNFDTIDEELKKANSLTAKDIGAFVGNVLGDGDLNTVLLSGDVGAFLISRNAKNTPFSQGVSGSTDGLVFSTNNGSGYGVQLAVLDGEKNLYVRYANAGNISNWVVGFLPLDGSVPMTGDLRIVNGYAKFSANNSLAVINTYVDSQLGSAGSYRSLQLHNSFSKPDIAESALLTDDSGNNYKMYGEHNITKDTTDMTAGTSYLANGCIRLIYE